MQLSELLQRLSPTDRKAMLERRRVPPALANVNKALTDFLAAPASVAAACTELNVAQFLILEWLASKPSKRALWHEFQEALKDRIPQELLVAFLTEMRQLALIDFKATNQQGFVETYPAATAVLPSARRPSLRQLLEMPTTDVLLRMCGAIGLKNAPTRKDGRIAALTEAVTDPKTLKEIVGRLSDGARALFDEMIARGGPVSASELSQRFPAKPDLYYGGARWSSSTIFSVRKTGDEPDAPTELMRCGLIFGDLTYTGYWTPQSFLIPDEIKAAYTGLGVFDGVPLTPPQLESAEAATDVDANLGHLLRDLGHLLGFIATGKFEWKQDGEPYKRSLTALGKLIGRPDETYVSALWQLALGSELVTRSRHPSSANSMPYEVTPVQDLVPKQIFQRAIVGLGAMDRQTFNRGSNFYLTDYPQLRFLYFLRTMPLDVWVTCASVERWAQFALPVLFNPSLVSMPGTGAPLFGQVMDRLILRHGRTADGADVVMFPSGAYDAIHPDLGRASAALPAWETTFVVQPDRTIVAPPNLHIDVLIDLWRIAALESNHGATVFRISAQSVAAALNLGLTPERIRETLTKHSRGPLPSTVERLIDDQSARYGRIKVGAATTFVQTDEPELLEELRKNAKLKHLEWIDVVPGVAFVRGSYPESVVDTLRKAGYLPVRAEPEQRPAAPTSQTAPAPQAAPLQIVGSRPLPPKEIRRLTREALNENRILVVTHGKPGKVKTQELFPIDLRSNELHAEDVASGREVEIDFLNIYRIDLGDPDSAFDDDDYPLLDEPHDTRPDLMQVIESLMDGSRGRKKKGK